MMASRRSKQTSTKNLEKQVEPPQDQTAKKRVPVTTQKNIKEMLLLGRRKRKQQQELQVEVEDIILPDYLLEFSDIRAVTNNKLPTYEVSKLAVQYAKCHSNIEDVVAMYVALKKKNEPTFLYISSALSTCVSFPLMRLCAPFDKFYFTSPYNEEVCRTLLRHPAIETQQQLDEFMQFSNKHKLKLASVSMLTNNEVNLDSCYWLKRLKEIQKTDKIPKYTRQAFERHIQHKYYLRENVVQHLALANLSVEDIEKVSNFKRTVLNEMEAQKKPEVFYASIAKFMLQSYKNDPSVFLANKNIVISPLYEITVNNLTDDQQDLIASDFDKFCAYINIGQVCRSASPRMTSEQAYQLYVGRTQIGRKLTPFHRMLWIGCENTDDDAIEPVQPSATASHLTYQRKPRFEKNAEPATVEPPVQLVDDESSSDASRTTTVLRPQSTPVKVVNSSTAKEREPELSPVLERSPEPEEVPESSNEASNPTNTAQGHARYMSPKGASTSRASNRTLEFTPTVYSGMPGAIPDRFLNSDLDMEDSIKIIGPLMANSCFIKELKIYLEGKYPVDFEIHWATNKKLISASFIHFCWIDDLQLLVRILGKCGTSEITKQAIEMIAEKLVAQTTLSQSADSVAEDHLYHNTSEIAQATPGNVPVATVLPVVKQEPISQLYTICENSEVVCLGEHVASEIIIDDTQSPDDSLIRDLEAGNNDSPHAFLNLIEGGTQEDEVVQVEEAQAAAKYSNRTLETLQAFEPIASRQLREDKQSMTVTPTQRDQPGPSKVPVRKFFKVRPGPRSSKRKVQTTSAVEYIDEDSESPGNETSSPTLDEALNDELSVFFSTQIMLDAQHPVSSNVPPCPFKIVRSSENHSETFAANVSFLVNLQQVVFLKDVKFELFVNLPQYNLYHIMIEGASCRPLLDINDQEFSAIMQLLNTIERYEYNRSEATPHYEKGETFIAKQLDMFFSTQIRFKFFHFTMNDDKIDCFDGNNMPLTHGNLTSAIDLEILQAVASIKGSLPHL